MSKKSNKKKIVTKKKKVIVTSVEDKKRITPTVSRSKSPVSIAATGELIFQRENLLLMLLGAVLVLVGMLLMTGGAMPDPNTWDPNIIYSKRITLLGPVVILTGLIIEIVAIFKK